MEPSGDSPAKVHVLGINVSRDLYPVSYDLTTAKRGSEGGRPVEFCCVVRPMPSPQVREMSARLAAKEEEISELRSEIDLLEESNAISGSILTTVIRTLVEENNTLFARSPVDEQSGMDALIAEMQRINRLIALKVSRF